MADILLSDEKRSNYPFAKNWLDQFRVATDNIAAEVLQQEAEQMNCTILHENRCYCEDGSVREVCHNLSMNALKKLLDDWKKCAEDRSTMFAQQHLKYSLIKQMAAQIKTLTSLEAHRSELHFKIR